MCASRLLAPFVIILYLRIRAAYRVLGFPQKRSLAWRYIWQVNMRHLTGPIGPGLRVVIAALALLLAVMVLYAVGLPIVLASAAFVTTCPTDAV